MKKSNVHERINQREQLVATRNYFHKQILKGRKPNGDITYDPSLMACFSTAIGNVYRVLKPSAKGKSIYWI